MTQATKLYPIGIQTFEKIRNGNYLYIDKTEIIYRLTHAASNYVFPSRPRRFGKSLLTSTLKAYFEGRRDLFKGLAMERLENRMDEIPRAAFRHELGQAHGKGTVGTLPIVPTGTNRRRLRHTFGLSRFQYTADKTYPVTFTSRRTAKWWCSSMNTMRPCST